MGSCMGSSNKYITMGGQQVQINILTFIELEM